MRGAPEPAGEEGHGGPRVRVGPEPLELLFEHPRAHYVRIRVLDSAEGGPLRGGHVLGPQKPKVLGAGQSGVPVCLSTRSQTGRFTRAHTTINRKRNTTKLWVILYR
jgi:hypothetical protein